MLVYRNSDGMVIAKIPEGQSYDYLEGSNSHIILSQYPEDIFKYKIIKNELVEMSNVEIEEMDLYGKILTEEEREELNNIPKQPTVNELQEQIKELNMIVDTILGVDIE